MPWIRIDDHFNEHPKLAAAGPLGWALWFAGLAYSNRNLTDGFIPWATAGSLVSWDFLEPSGEAVTVQVHDEEVNSAYVISLLVGAGLWKIVKGGYRIHDYADFQPSRAEILKERARWADVKRRSRPNGSPGESPGGSPSGSPGGSPE